MYIRDEHPLRNRIRYHTMRGMGIGPEIVTPEGCVPVLQQSSPPMNGLMTPMTDTYTTLTPVMAPLPSRYDLGHAKKSRFQILPVEMGAEDAVPVEDSESLSGYGRGGGAGQGQSREWYGFSMGTCIGCR